MTVFSKDALAGYKVIVTGGGSGICKGIALKMAAHGADVAVVGRRMEKLEETVAEIEALGQKGAACQADVREYDQVEAAIAKAVDAFGGLDVVVNGAAGNFLAPAIAMSPNAFKSVVDIDLRGSYHFSRAAFEALSKSDKASILNISATLHYNATPMQLHVSAAKAGIDAMTRNLALEWGPAGVRVNGIAPGPIADTEGMSRLTTPEQRQKLEKRVPVQRLGAIEDIAKASLFLTSDAASYISGHTMVVDGGAWLLGSIIDPSMFG